MEELNVGYIEITGISINSSGNPYNGEIAYYLESICSLLEKLYLCNKNSQRILLIRS